jgi:SAM-dependent methyltransferase
MLHHVFLLALDDRLFLAPIKPNPSRVLDVGTGTGIWAIDTADQHPSAYIKGLDLSPIQPESVPPNLQFMVDDVEQDWDEPDKYDYIHCRNVVGSIKDWPRLVRQMYESLKPGGWVELQGFVNQPYSQDKTLSSNNPLAQLMDGLREAGEKRDRNMEPAASFKRWAQSTGFVEVDERRFKLPVGTWPKDPKLNAIGAFMAETFSRGVGGITAVPFRDVLRWSREEVEVLNANVRRMVARRDIHTILDFVVVTGMKPMTGQ